ncbi:MAG: sensor histidine kinase [Bdellovibrionales bacterium]|nr:sensor histidine kinase [Bdellovibrionales bacterium]
MRRVRCDLLRPLESGFSSDEEISIAELETLRLAQIEATRAKIQGAVVEALLQRDKQIAHDIRAPISALGVILTSVASMEDEQRALSKMALQRIRKIANDLSHHHAESFRTLNVRACNLVEALTPVIAEQRARHIHRAEVAILTRSRATGAFCALVDPLELQRAVSNLIDNAVEAIDSAGHVAVDLVPNNTYIDIVVRDNGRGIPPDILPNLGNKGATFGKVGGSGLGLFHARKLAEACGGRLSIDSEPNTGTTVKLQLPLVSIDSINDITAASL